MAQESAQQVATMFTPGPWAYRPDQYDDWGVVRSSPDDEGRQWHIAKASIPRKTDKSLNEHRRDGTDPAEANARLIAAAPDLYRAIEHAIESIESGNLYEQMCCNGFECGCYGASYAEFLVHHLRRALTEAAGEA